MLVVSLVGSAAKPGRAGEVKPERVEAAGASWLGIRSSRQEVSKGQEAITFRKVGRVVSARNRNRP